MSLVLVTHKQKHAVGHTVAGLGRRVYWVGPDGLLYAVPGGSRDAAAAHSEDPGVLPEDAEEFRLFPATFKVAKAAPQPPADGQGGASSEPDSPQGASPVASALPPPPPPRAKKAILPHVPTDPDEYTLAEWLKLADRLGVPMSDNDKRTRPKADLVSCIRANAAKHDNTST